MSSREIADLVNSRHDSVKRTIGTLAESGVISYPQIVDGIKSANGVVPRHYLVSKRDSFVIVAQLSPEFTAALVDRWQELESHQALSLPDFSSPAAAARAWAEQFELQQTANEALAIAAPKAAFVDQYVEASGSMGFRQVAKLLSANERQFRQMLLDKGAMYYLGGVLTPYSQHQDADRFEVKTGTSETSGHAFSQARFTPKGVQWVAGLWSTYQMEISK
ncbi:phage antirepressor KilAC domain-containing protein [Pseudomonas sp.]|uniref:phage antirepressor KilAC domain-containing protein n=1 Tax=Pseudomonas sp. TaxID=306 RepID=UPI00326512B6